MVDNLIPELGDMNIVVAADVTRNEEEGWRQWCAGDPYSGWNDQYVLRYRRDTAAIIFIFYYKYVNFIKIANYECNSRRKYLFIIFFLSCTWSAKKALFTVTPTRSLSGAGADCRRPQTRRAHTHHLFYKPPVFLDFWMYVYKNIISDMI